MEECREHGDEGVPDARQIAQRQFAVVEVPVGQARLENLHDDPFDPLGVGSSRARDAAST